MPKHSYLIAIALLFSQPAIASCQQPQPQACTSSITMEGIVTGPECEYPAVIGPDSVAQPGGPIGNSGQPIVEGDRK